jgi:hypothetical protein
MDLYVCTTDDLLKGVLGGAVNQGTIESVCADLLGTPDPDTSSIDTEVAFQA